MTEMTSTDPGLIRASNDDRELAVADLYDACRRGRLTADEYQVRLEVARRAPTLGDLWTLTGDIPRSIVPAVAQVAQVASPPMWNAVGPYGPSVWAAPPVPVPVRPQRVQPLAVVAFAISLFGLVTSALVYGSAIALVLAVVALVQVRDAEDGSGHGLATAALAISATSLLIAVDILLHSHG